jgi:hypothetical protein
VPHNPVRNIFLSAGSIFLFMKKEISAPEAKRNGKKDCIIIVVFLKPRKKKLKAENN